MGLVAVARALAIDTVTAEVAGALQAVGVEPILIKGPTVSQWLYDETEPRTYVDSDLLVSPTRQPDAERVLEELGFERQHYDWEIRQRLFHAGSWHRARDGGLVDLHLTLPGIRGASPEEVWSALSARTVPWTLPQNVTVHALDLPARLLLVGLHAVHHLDHGAEARPLADLRRAIERAGMPNWLHAAALAKELRSGGDIARALYAIEEGPPLAQRIGLTSPASGREDTVGIERILAARGRHERMKAIRRAVFPARSYLYYTLPIARRGPAWLGMAYVRRPFLLAARFPKAYRVWRASQSGET